MTAKPPELAAMARVAAQRIADLLDLHGVENLLKEFRYPASLDTPSLAQQWSSMMGPGGMPQQQWPGMGYGGVHGWPMAQQGQGSIAGGRLARLQSVVVVKLCLIDYPSRVLVEAG